MAQKPRTRYNGDPPSHFACGHPRERPNMRFIDGAPICRICNLAYERAKQVAFRAARREAAFLASIREKPHLYPTTTA